MNQSNKRSSKRKAGKNKFLPMLIGLGGILLVGLAFFALSGKPSGRAADIEVTGSSSLKVDKEKVDLGDVKLGQWVEVSFQLTNVGEQQLRFTEKPYVEVVEGC